MECGTVPPGTVAVQMNARTLSLWGPVVAWAGLIFALSSVPALVTGLEPWDLALRKLGHFVEFAILGGLLLRALRDVPAAVLAGAAYAVTDEVHQIFVSGRQGSPLDWLIDTAGVVAGVAIALRLARAQG
jgi:VanZ family protein